MSDEETTDETEVVQHSPVADQGAFLQALGINGAQVATGSITINFGDDGIPLLGFRMLIKVPPTMLGAAFFAATQGIGGGAGAESEPLDQPKKDTT